MFSHWAPIMAAAYRHAQTGKQTSNCWSTLFSSELKLFNIPPKKVASLEMSRSHALGHANAITWTFPPRCCWLRNPLLCTFPCPLLLLLPPSLPTVLSYLLLSSSSCCHSVTLHLLTPLSLAPSVRLSPLATTSSWKMRGNYLLCQLRFFSPLSVFMHSASAVFVCSRRPFALFSLPTLWFYAAATAALWSLRAFVWDAARRQTFFSETMEPFIFNMFTEALSRSLFFLFNLQVTAHWATLWPRVVIATKCRWHRIRASQLVVYFCFPSLIYVTCSIAFQLAQQLLLLLQYHSFPSSSGY